MKKSDGAFAIYIDEQGLRMMNIMFKSKLILQMNLRYLRVFI